jgi:hypothetical protein
VSEARERGEQGEFGKLFHIIRPTMHIATPPAVFHSLARAASLG